MNVLTRGTAFGAIVLVFQHGFGTALLNAGSAGPCATPDRLTPGPVAVPCRRRDHGPAARLRQVHPVQLFDFERARTSTVGDMDRNRESRTWIITGATSGLGLALAEAALEAGEQVVGTARRVERFDRLQSDFGERLLMVAHDVRDVDRAAAVVQAAVARFGRVDVLVNNAGVGQVGAAEEVTDEGCGTCSHSTSSVRPRTSARCCRTCVRQDQVRSCR